MIWSDEARIEILDISGRAPPTLENDHWPCLRCKRSHLIRRMRRVVARVRGSREGVFLVCVECVDELRHTTAGR
jgi:hypothetical protein